MLRCGAKNLITTLYYPLQFGLNLRVLQQFPLNHHLNIYCNTTFMADQHGKQEGLYTYDSFSGTTSSTNSFNFFWWCAGVHQQLLRQYPSEKVGMPILKGRSSTTGIGSIRPTRRRTTSRCSWTPSRRATWSPGRGTRASSTPAE